MSDGTKIIETIRYVKSLFEQTALLLRTADELMAEKGFDERGNVAITAPSGKIQVPHQWMPDCVFRFYYHDEYPRVLPCIAALLDDNDGALSGPIQVPLLSACAFVAPEGWENNWQYWWAHWHWYMPDRRDDGTVMRIDDMKTGMPEEKEDYPFKKVITLGVPLLEVTNSAELSSKIVEPFIASFAEFKKAAGTKR